MLRRAYFDRYGSREIIRVNNRKPEQKGRNRNLWHHVSLFFVVVGFLCTNMHQPASVLQTDWVPSSKFNHQFFHPTLSPQASEEWCTKSLTSRTLHRGKKDGMPACRGIFAMISFSSGYCKIYAIALFFGYWTCPWKKQYVKHACWAVGATLFVTFVFGFPPLLCCPDWLDKLWCFPIIIGTIDS